jgi:hypothetical protein
MAKQFECERDGVVIRGADDDEQWRRWSATLPRLTPSWSGRSPARTSSRRRRRREMTAGDGPVLRLKRVLLSPRAAVYGPLSDPRGLGKWWGHRSPRSLQATSSSAS